MPGVMIDLVVVLAIVISSVALIAFTQGEIVVPGIVIDLVVVLVTVISFVALIAFTRGCDRL
ncbi:MAG TPA: hypothetical protein VGD98_04135 [Ktedonobacteraceae bacterium]